MPACLLVRVTAASRGQAPHGNASLPPLSRPPLSRLLRCFQPWVPWASSPGLCRPLSPSPSLSLFFFLFHCLCSWPVVSALCAGAVPSPPPPPAAACLPPCLVSCFVVLRSVVGCFVWFVAFCGVFRCLVVLVSCCVVCCRAVLLVLVLAVSRGRCFSLFLLVSRSASLCRAVSCGVLSCAVPSRVVVWCVVPCAVLVRGVGWSSGPSRCVGFSCLPAPPLAVAPFCCCLVPCRGLSLCSVQGCGAVLLCCAACRVVCCCLCRLLLVLPGCFIRAGWCCVLLPVVAGCLLLGLVARCCFALACFGAGAPAWPRGCAVQCWSVLCPVIYGAVLPCGAVLLCTAVRFALFCGRCGRRGAVLLLGAVCGALCCSSSCRVLCPRGVARCRAPLPCGRCLVPGVAARVCWEFWLSGFVFWWRMSALVSLSGLGPPALLSGVLVRCPVVSCAPSCVLRCCAALWCCAIWQCCAFVRAAGFCFSFRPLCLCQNPCCFSAPLKTFLKPKIKMFLTRKLDTTELTHTGRQQYQSHVSDLHVATRPRRWWACLQGVDGVSPRACRLS